MSEVEINYFKNEFLKKNVRHSHVYDLHKLNLISMIIIINLVLVILMNGICEYQAAYNRKMNILCNNLIVDVSSVPYNRTGLLYSLDQYVTLIRAS